MFTSIWIVLAVAALVLSTVGGWLLTLFSLPGNWIIVGAAALFTALVGPDSMASLSWTTVIALTALASLGEIVETAASAVGVARHGASKRAALLAIVGSVIGSLIGAAVGLPIPVIGSVVGAILFAGIGALVGAVLGEEWKGTPGPKSWRIGQAAFWGRLMGTLGKVAIASVMLVVTLLALIF